MKGYIFRCNDKTIKEVFERQLFGDEIIYVSTVKTIEPKDRLFLYNLSTFEFSGPYAPNGEGGSRLVPAAWKAKFPAQIKFKLLPETRTIPFNRIEKIIKIYHKCMFLDMLLDEIQTSEIMQLMLEN